MIKTTPNKLQELINVTFGMIVFLVMVGIAGSLEADTINVLQFVSYEISGVSVVFTLWVLVSMLNTYITRKVIK